MFGSEGSLAEDREEDRTPEQWAEYLTTWSNKLVIHKNQQKVSFEISTPLMDLRSSYNVAQRMYWL